MARLPNILWILTTQWRAQACGYMGDPNARTPCLDAWSVGAANFRQAVTPHPFGPFARAALLTGVPSPANGIRGYFDPLPSSARTVAHLLEERGYQTGFFGKWHLAPRDPNEPLVGEAHAKMVVPPEYRGGFGFWEGFESGFQLNDPWLHGSRLPQPTRFAGYQSDVVCLRAAEWLRQQSTASREPWFCVVSMEPPHPPYAVAPASDAVDASILRLPANVPRGTEVEQKARQELAGYYAHIAVTDRAIGRLLDAVDDDTTASVVTSVHGDMHGAHGLFRKGWPYEESIRVPLLVRVPPEISADDFTGPRDDLVSLLDLRAWALDWADGEKWAPRGAAAQQVSMPSVVALPHQCDRAWRGVRTAVRKLIVTDTTGDDGKPRSAPWLYFDLQSDPWEQTNLAGDSAHRAEMDALRSLVKLPAPNPGN